MDEHLNQERKPNPREKTNIFSAATFCWTLPTFKKGYKRDLEESDLTQTLRAHQSAKLGNKLETAWNKELKKSSEKKKKKPSLLLAMTKVFGAELMLYGVITAIFEIGLRTLQPLALGQLVLYFRTDQTEITKNDAYLYAGVVILCSLGNVFVLHPTQQAIVHMGMKFRVACCSVIYRKALKLSKTALGQTTVGQIVNLLSNDVNRFDISTLILHYLWIGPIETAVMTYFMYQQIGISAVIGVGSLLLFAPLQGWLGRRTSKLRTSVAIRTDERVRLMNEIIAGIQVIKMYTWEKPFAALVAKARKNEIKYLRSLSYLRGVIVSFIMFSTRISIFVCVLAYVLFGNDITAEKVFVVTSFYNVLRQTMTTFFPVGIALTAETLVSIKRIEGFLLYDEIEQTNAVTNKKSSSKHSDNIILSSIADEKSLELQSMQNNKTKEKGIIIKNLTAKWIDNSSDNTLTNINLIIKSDQLTAIIGPVGAGKSSLLHLILKELPLKEGTLEINGVISYASQEPWLFAGSIRQNILFGLPLDKIRYKKVIKACSLKRDFSLLPYADKTIVGERGISLSGGQRARINLARAVYKEADIYLLDDPLSAVDTHVGKKLFENCITGFLKDKTVLLITHQIQYLKKVDHLVILNDGEIQAEGTYRDLKDSGLNFAKLLKEDVKSSENTEQPEYKDENKRIKKISVIQNENKRMRKISVYQNENKGMRKVSVIQSETEENENDKEPVQIQEQKSSGKLSFDVYKGYFGAGGNFCRIFIMFFMFLLAQLLASSSDYFITYWVNLEESRTEHEKTNTKVEDSFWNFSRENCIIIFSVISIATVIISLSRSFIFFATCMRASKNLHNKMFNNLICATMRFFNTNISGRILNRFSKDMGTIDDILTMALVDVLQIGLQLLGTVIVVATVNPWLLLPTAAIAFLSYLLRVVYLSSSRSLKRLEGVTRSPVFGHLNASLQGLTTIRAFRAENILEKEFDAHQDLHSSAWFLFISLSRTFAYWLDLVLMLYIGMVTFSFLILENENYAGDVGLVITQAIALSTTFQWGIRQSTELENQMTSVERVLEYSNLEQEPPLQSSPEQKPAETWPEKGQIEFQNIYLKYAPDEPPVLKNLSFVIKPNEKIGIVGRTGAGKSSLISAIFQLATTDGSIIIDSINIQNIGLHDLRSKISIIPQEPVLFSGTMRYNLDPFDEYTDDVIWRALEQVELKQAVADLPGNLNSKMSEGGTNFSVGQRQLICLARAIVRNNKILLLDEATANIDPQTDTLIQKTIRDKFKNCTVLTIAHRLNTVIDSDKILVMDAGELVEFDHPYFLLKNKNGFLYRMVEQTGINMAENLTKIAEENYILKGTSEEEL